MHNERIWVSVSTDQSRQLRALAAANRLPVSAVARMAIDRFLGGPVVLVPAPTRVHDQA